MALELYRYPEKPISRLDDYLMINIQEYKAPGLKFAGENILSLISGDDSSAGGLLLSQSAIILPLPKAISDGHGASWGDNSVNSLMAAGYNTANELISGGMGAAFENANNVFISLTGEITDGSGQQTASAAASGLAVNALAGKEGNINDLVSRATGQVVNPNVELLFNGVLLRSGFNFTFDLMPRNATESTSIKNIIRTLKKSMLPGKSVSEFFVTAPKVFKLRYMRGSKDHPFLNKFKLCALTNMSVDYTGSGQYSSYHDGTPIHMTMNLQFQELSPIYSTDYDSPEVTGGVGY